MIGETDDFGYSPAEAAHSVQGLHGTIRYLLGLDHPRLTFFHSGRDFRLTDVAGEENKKAIA